MNTSTSTDAWGVLRRALPALAAFLVVRIVGVLVLAAWSDDPRKGVHRLMSRRWDSLWYARIARDGYGYAVRTASGDLHSDLAFFPLLPLLERAGHVMTGVPVPDVGLVVSVVTSMAAAVGVHAVAEFVVGREDSRGVSAGRLGTVHSAPFLAVVLWALYPVAGVQWMAYSESLFTALAAWSLYAVLTGRWVSAGLLAALAGLTRPVGISVVLAVWFGVALACRERRRGAPGTSHTKTAAARRPGWRAALGVVLAPLGLVAYVMWVARRTGRGLSGYLDVQAGWRNGFDGGWAFARFIAEKFSTPGGAVAGVGLVVGVALVLWGCVACVRARLPGPVLVYVGVLVALALGARGYFGSKPRFLVPVFPLWFPLARWLSARAPRQLLPGLGAFLVVSSIVGAVWLTGSGPP